MLVNCRLRVVILNRGSIAGYCCRGGRIDGGRAQIPERGNDERGEYGLGYDGCFHRAKLIVKIC